MDGTMDHRWDVTLLDGQGDPALYDWYYYYIACGL